MRRIYLSEDQETLAIINEGESAIILNLYEEDEESGTEAPEPPKEIDEEKENRPAPTAKQIVSGRKCSKCGMPGHNASTCFRKQDSAQDDEQDGLALLDKVQELKNEGVSSAEVAKKLNISLVRVNGLW